MSKELFLEQSELESMENPPIEIEQENSEYIELMKRLQNKTEVLSYSSLKAFGKSPRNFIQYKLEPRKPQSESQIFGSVCDTLLTEPEKFDDKYAVVDNVPTTDNQIGFCNDLIKGMSAIDAKKANNPRGEAGELAEIYKAYCDAQKSGKQTITTEVKEKCEKIVENLKKSELVMQYVDGCSKFQVKTEWKYSGWNFIGFKDGQGTNLIVDFKYSADSDPDKFERDIFKFDYFMQAGMYVDSEEGFPEYYLIVYDKSMNFSVLKIDVSLISYGIRKYKYLVKKMEQCIKENRWSESYNFFDVQQRTVFKPKWVKGFETDPDDVE